MLKWRVKRGFTYGRHVLPHHDGPAVIAGDRTLSYADLRAARAPGGELVGNNSPEFVLGLVGAWNAGETVVPLSGRLRGYELDAIRANLKGSGPFRNGTILYTSGSTGAPKGVHHSTQSLGHWAATLAEVMELTPEDRVGLIIPMSHAFGLATLLAALYAGAAVVLVENERALPNVLPGLTVLTGTPAVFAPLAPSTIRGLVGGMASPAELFARHPRVLNVYGMTEIGGAAVSRPHDTAGPLHPVRGYEIRAVDGELQVKGAGVTPGYHGGPETGEWFATGDLGTVAEDGSITIHGRAQEVIHVGGFNVFPAEVETFLLTHPEVSEAAVVGAPHPRMGEVVKAYVVASAPAAELIRYARRNIAGYKVPYGIEIRDALPKRPNGKIDKGAL
jgi:acyl-CoA synthetase (AMP-forming)/AMP-acid ligase II